jgi:hypothetical protein
MIATLIVLLIVTIMALVFLPFSRALMQDRRELESNPLDRKFEILIGRINSLMMGGLGKVIKTQDPRQVNLFSDDSSNMIIQFYYSTGTLTIILKYKYFHVELVKQLEFHQMRQAETFRQQDVANHFVEEARIAIKQHQSNVSCTMGLRDNNNEFQFTGLANENDSNNPVDIVRNMYDDLSHRQKIALVAIAESIFTADNSSISDFQRHNMFSNMLLSLQVNYSEVRQMFGGKDIDSAVDTILADGKPELSVLLITVQPFLYDENGAIEQRVIKYYTIFERLGFSRDDVDNETEKMIALTNLFTGR